MSLLRSFAGFIYGFYKDDAPDGAGKLAMRFTRFYGDDAPDGAGKLAMRFTRFYGDDAPDGAEELAMRFTRFHEEWRALDGAEKSATWFTDTSRLYS